ncbi:MAG: archaellin/type IV pilin N-terminal domain-containing protein [archaeon]|nr:archaellin/type IV pilin N-terminal domain-containing protein [archaeon]
MKCIQNRRKGITPVIAIVLLLMMTVAAAGLAYEFIMNMSEKQTEAIGEKVEGQSDKMRTEIRILQIQENGADLDFLIKNTGSIEIYNITKATTDYEVGGKIETTPDFSGDCTSSTIEIGETCTLTVDGQSLPSVGTVKTFKFILPSGYTFAYGCNRASATDDFC